MPETTTEAQILQAALKVFTEKGFAAARTQDIAREAGINRALLHYYFRDKETIFNLVFESQFREFAGGLQTILNTEAHLFEKIRQIIDHEISTLQHNPHLARFIIVEITRAPEKLLAVGARIGINPAPGLNAFVMQVHDEVQQQTIRHVDGRQLFINIMSMCIYPFVARPVIKTMFSLDEEMVSLMMEERKQFVYEFIINAIKK